MCFDINAGRLKRDTSVCASVKCQNQDQNYLEEFFNIKNLFQNEGVNHCCLLSSDGGSSTEGSMARSDSPAPSAPFPPQEETEKPPDPELEKRLLAYLSDLSLPMPMDSLAITNDLNSVSILS